MCIGKVTGPRSGLGMALTLWEPKNSAEVVEDIVAAKPAWALFRVLETPCSDAQDPRHAVTFEGTFEGCFLKLPFRIEEQEERYRG